MIRPSFFVLFCFLFFVSLLGVLEGFYREEKSVNTKEG